MRVPTIVFAVALATLVFSVYRFGGPRAPVRTQRRLAVSPRLPHARAASLLSPPPPPPPRSICGDGVCDATETVQSCFADCPGVTTPAVCGEEAHSDPGGNVPKGALFGMDPRAKAASASECCARCMEHAADPAHSAQPCNSWTFCPLPICWGLDTGWNHTFGECWLKWQQDAAHPLYGQRGEYSPEYRVKHRQVRGGPPSHVPWTGGVIGATIDRSVRWTTGPDGMKSSRGEELTNWRAWEAAGVYEKRLTADLAANRRTGRAAGS
jgi:hypothetical protein